MNGILRFVANHIPELLCVLWVGFLISVLLEDKAYQKLTLNGIFGFVLTIERLNDF